MNFNTYVENAEKPAGFKPTGLTREYYLDIIEKCLAAYDAGELVKRLPEPGGMVDDIHSMSRIACSIAALLSNGRKPELMDLWMGLMDALCNDFHRRTPPTTLDFALKETMLAFKAMKPYVKEEKRNYWLHLLSKIDPFRCYSNVEGNQSWEHIRNWNIYAMAGYFLLETEGAADSTELFERHWDHQFKYFDENGMYLDPNFPFVYDITTRVQAQLITGYGYKGKYAEKLDEHLKNGALNALFYQSAAFELPFGGRSNQFLFNETLFASNFEYEAARWKKQGNLKLAGMYKRAARLGVKSIERWLDAPGGARHLKNMFPTKSKYGVEGYAYYDKYMITAASFLYIGFPFADDSIEEFPCPAELGGYVYQPAEHFHKVFANAGSYSIEIDTSGDFFYDATGLGRIHKAKAPTELALSAPSGRMHGHRFNTPGCDEGDMSLCPGWLDGKNSVFLSEFGNNEYRSFEYLKDKFETGEEFRDFIDTFPTGLKNEVEVFDKDPARFSITYSGDLLPEIASLIENYTVSSNGVLVEAQLENPVREKIFYSVPAFLENGADGSNITCGKNVLTVTSMGWTYTVETDGTFVDAGRVMGNRNGRYAIYTAQKDSKSIKMKFKIEKNEEE